jgi:hypothetical protein
LGIIVDSRNEVDIESKKIRKFLNEIVQKKKTKK